MFNTAGCLSSHLLPATYSLTSWTLLIGLLFLNMYKLKGAGSLPTFFNVETSGMVYLPDIMS